MSHTIQHIHPIIRIMCFVIMGGFLVAAQPRDMLIASSLILLGFALGNGECLRQTWRVLARLKWLFLSILMIYFFMTPGRAVLPGLGDAITTEGVRLGLLRVSSLVLIIAAVNLLVRSAAQHELSFAVLWLLAPLKRLGFPADRLAVRMVLTLAYVAEFQDLLIKEKSGMPIAEQHGRRPIARDEIRQGLKQRFYTAINGAADKASDLFQEVLKTAAEKPCAAIHPPIQILPSAWQWLIPPVLVGLFLLG